MPSFLCGPGVKPGTSCLYNNPLLTELSYHPNLREFQGSVWKKNVSNLLTVYAHRVYGVDITTFWINLVV